MRLPQDCFFFKANVLKFELVCGCNSQHWHCFTHYVMIRSPGKKHGLNNPNNLCKTFPCGTLAALHVCCIFLTTELNIFSIPKFIPFSSTFQLEVAFHTWLSFKYHVKRIFEET